MISKFLITFQTRIHVLLHIQSNIVLNFVFPLSSKFSLLYFIWIISFLLCLFFPFLIFTLCLLTVSYFCWPSYLSSFSLFIYLSFFLSFRWWPFLALITSPFSLLSAFISSLFFLLLLPLLGFDLSVPHSLSLCAHTLTLSPMQDVIPFIPSYPLSSWLSLVF